MTDFLSKNSQALSYLAAIITSSDDAIISKDLNGNITSWNPAAEVIFGYKPDEIVGKHISVLIPPENLPEEDYILGQVKAGNRVEHFEAVRRTKSGSLVNLSVTVSPIKDENGVIVGASKVARDITKLKEAARIGSYLSAIIESSDDAIISKDLKGFITSWNNSAERIFGYTSEEAVGRHITLIIPPERLQEEDKILTTLQTGKRVDHFETMRRHKDGHLVPVSLTVSPIRDEAGKIIGASKVSRDISERIKAAQEIIEIAKKKDEFLANMSHELRTPMNAVIGLSHILGAMTDMPEKATKYIDTLKLSADNLMNLINDLLDFSRIESGAMQLEEVEFNLAEQIEKAVNVMNVRAKEKNIELFVNYEPTLARHFIGDPLRIHQVVINLLSNAVKFTEEGSVRLAVTDTQSKTDGSTLVAIQVTDTGVGIEPDKLGSIFDKFTQADASITRRYGGSGLGLAIAKACVDKMGGTITVESRVGLGSTFIITLPLRNSTIVSSHKNFSVTTAPEENRGRKHVLLVEDYEPNILVAGTILEELGYDYDSATNGAEALRKFVESDYDVILMDIQMHDVDGFEATRRIRKLEEDNARDRTPIIAMTAHVRDQDKSQCLEAGMDDFIPKPFQISMLAEKIAQHVKKDKEVSAPAIVRRSK